MQLAAAQIQGARKRQEDAFAIETCAEGWLALVADGLGGQPCGDLASQEALRVFVAAFKEAAAAESPVSPDDALMNALLSAQERVLELEGEDAERLGMSTTLVAVYATRDAFWHLSVGDSLILRLHDNRLSLVNRPHTKDGYITSCVGRHMDLVDNSGPHTLVAGDRLLLASDGILSMPLEETGRILRGAPDAQTAVEAMLQAVSNVRNEWQDNATLVALFVSPSGRGV
jgi:protein phosphatase